MKRKLNFMDFTAIMAFTFAALDLGFFIVKGGAPTFLLKCSITFLCMNLMISNLKS